MLPAKFVRARIRQTPSGVFPTPQATSAVYAKSYKTAACAVAVCWTMLVWCEKLGPKKKATLLLSRIPGVTAIAPALDQSFDYDRSRRIENDFVRLGGGAVPEP